VNDGKQRLIAELLDWVLLVSLGLVAVLVLAAWLIVKIRKRFRDNEDPAATDHRMLNQMKELHREGDLSVKEYRSIKSRLAERMDESAHARKNDGQQD